MKQVVRDPPYHLAPAPARDGPLASDEAENPSYEEVCSGATGHAEAVRVVYDPTIMSLKSLTEALFRIIDPLSVNKQGNDRSTQYRTGVYYTDDADLPILQMVFEAEQEKLASPMATELAPLKNFYEAEGYLMRERADGARRPSR